MRVVLATPPAEGHMDHLGASAPMGLLYVATSVSQLHGLTVCVVDGITGGLSLEEASEKIVAFEPDLLGLSVMSTNIQRGVRLIKRVKELRPSVAAIFGGIHATMFDDLILNEVPEVDMAMRGEAELSFPMLCNRLVEGEDIAGVPGLSYRSGGTVIRGTPQVVQDLDALPFVNWDAVDTQLYYKSWGPIPLPRVLKVAGTLSSRGCPYRCSFCSRPPAAQAWRPRTAQNVLAELAQLSKSGFEYAVFHDDNFCKNTNRVKELCEMLITANLGMRFWFEGALHHLPQSTLDLMHQAGFDCVAVGVESGSDAQLRRFNKPGNSRMIASGIRRAKKAHMVVHGFFITGGPGETEEDHNSSKAFIRAVGPHSIGVGTLTLYPGSALWDQIRGSQDPLTLAESGASPIHEYKDQISKDTLQSRSRGLYKALARSWLRWGRISEVIDLTRRNGFVNQCLRLALRRLPRALGAIWTLHRTRRENRGPRRPSDTG